MDAITKFESRRGAIREYILFNGRKYAANLKGHFRSTTLPTTSLARDAWRFFFGNEPSGVVWFADGNARNLSPENLRQGKGGGLAHKEKERQQERQTFNGKDYFLYKGERYFSRGGKRLHRVVWEFYNGPIPKGYHIHHKDGNPRNNDIKNLELIKAREHEQEHQRIHKQEEGYWQEARARMAKAAEAAKEWHHSEAGRKWHSEHAKQQVRTPQEFVCECCGKTFTTINQGRNRFCSNACKSKWRRQTGADDITKVCPLCGKEFRTNKYRSSTYCSRMCASKAGHRGRRG